MSASKDIVSFQISFTPIGSTEYLEEIKQVINIIKKSGLENDIGILSTSVRGKKEMVFKLIEEIFYTMEDKCSFTMDIKLSNLCGCD